MAQVRGAVYSPPMKDLPPIAVIFNENEVIGARAVPSDEKGEAFLATMMQEFAGMVGHKGPAPKPGPAKPGPVASDMAGRTIDRLADQSVSAEDRAKRKRRLLHDRNPL